MPHLTISTPDAGTITYELENEVTTIGRIEENDLTIEDGSVSSHHARLTLQADGVLLEDLESTNGTKVNDAPITSIKLTGGEHILFGSIEVDFVADAPEPATAAMGAAQSPGEPAAIEPYTAMPAEVSRRPADFASEAPFPKRKNKTDPLQLAALAAGVVALLAFAGSMFLVTQMSRPF